MISSYPLNKLIIIYGLHMEHISRLDTNEDDVTKKLTEQGFNISDNLETLDILVYKNPKYTDQSKVTYIYINMYNLIQDIHHFTK